MSFFHFYFNSTIDFCMSINSEVFFLNFFENSYDNKYYTVSFDNVLDLNNNLLNFPLPGSEKMNALVILYLEVSYITLFIFFVVSFVLLETILVYSSSE